MVGLNENRDEITCVRGRKVEVAAEVGAGADDVEVDGSAEILGRLCAGLFGGGAIFGAGADVVPDLAAFLSPRFCSCLALTLVR